MKKFNLHMDKTAVELCKKLETSVLGYCIDGVTKEFPSAIYIEMLNDTLVFSSSGNDLEKYFECFSLKVEVSTRQAGKYTELDGWFEGENEVSLLVRTEGIFEDAADKIQVSPDRTIGIPRNIQKVLKNNQSVETPISLCNVTSGVSITNKEGGKLLVYTDTFPYSMQLAESIVDVEKALLNFIEIPLHKYSEYCNQNSI